MPSAFALFTQSDCSEPKRTSGTHEHHVRATRSWRNRSRPGSLGIASSIRSRQVVQTLCCGVAERWSQVAQSRRPRSWCCTSGIAPSDDGSCRRSSPARPHETRDCAASPPRRTGSRDSGRNRPACGSPWRHPSTHPRALQDRPGMAIRGCDVTSCGSGQSLDSPRRGDRDVVPAVGQRQHDTVEVPQDVRPRKLEEDPHTTPVVSGFSRTESVSRSLAVSCVAASASIASATTRSDGHIQPVRSHEALHERVNRVTSDTCLQAHPTTARCADRSSQQARRVRHAARSR